MYNRVRLWSAAAAAGLQTEAGQLGHCMSIAFMANSQTGAQGQETHPSHVKLVA